MTSTRKQVGIFLSTRKIQEDFKDFCDQFGLIQGIEIERFMIARMVAQKEKHIDILAHCESLTGPAEQHYEVRPRFPPKVAAGEYSEEQ